MRILNLLGVKKLSGVAAASALALFGLTAHSGVSLAQSAEMLTIKVMKIGNPVFGADGVRVGEINRIKANSDGRVTEIQVTTGGPAGLNAQVVSITADKIAQSGETDVKLSLSAADAKKLPVLGEDQKG
jgi:PRC-barrel domain